MNLFKELWKSKFEILITAILVAVSIVLISFNYRLLAVFPVVFVLYYGYHIFAENRLYPILAASVVGIIMSPIIIMHLLKQKLVLLNLMNTFVFGVGLFIVLISLTALFNKRKATMVVYSLLPFAVLYIVALVWGYYFATKAWVTDDVLLAIAQTNVGESIEWLKDFSSISSVIAMLVVLAILVFVIYLLYAIKYPFSLADYRKSLHLLVFGVLGFCFLNLGKDNIYYPSFKRAKEVLGKYKQFQEQYKQRQKGLATNYKFTSKYDKGVFVLVIGESQNKDHMQVYGYNRPTTPWLSEMAKNSNTVIMRNAFSCHTHTVPVITYAITAKNQYNNIALEKALSLIDVAKIAGYNTAWVSNQVKFGAWDTPNTVIASSAEQQIWINKQIGETTKTNSYDETLVDQVNKLKIHDKMLIVFHLMGNHGQYNQRYPKKFERFKGSSVVDSYDNSMLYNDYVVQKIYERCSKLPNFKGLLYCADHADAVKEKLWHNSGKFVYPMTHIPFYGVFTGEYIEENNENFTILRKNRNSIITNDLLFDTVNSIMGVKVEGVYNKNNDLLSNTYDSNMDRFTTLYGKRKIKDDSVFSQKH